MLREGQSHFREHLIGQKPVYCPVYLCIESFIFFPIEEKDYTVMFAGARKHRVSSNIISFNAKSIRALGALG